MASSPIQLYVGYRFLESAWDKFNHVQQNTAELLVPAILRLIGCALIGYMTPELWKIGGMYGELKAG